MLIARDPKAWRLYQELVAEIAQHLPERAGYFALAGTQSELAAKQSELAALRSEIAAKEEAQPPPIEPPVSVLLEMLYRSRILRTFGPLSKSWRFAKRVLQAHGIVKA
jgi:hypothetical protein